MRQRGGQHAPFTEVPKVYQNGKVYTVTIKPDVARPALLLSSYHDQHTFVIVDGDGCMVSIVVDDTQVISGPRDLPKFNRL